MTIKAAIQTLLPSACIHVINKGPHGFFYQVRIRRGGKPDLVLGGGDSEDEAWAFAAAVIQEKARGWR